MTQAMQTHDVQPLRKAAISAAIEDIRQIETKQGVTREALESIKARLIELARDRSIFPPSDFPAFSGERNDVHLLQEDPDGRFALYMVIGATGGETPPHDHTTWAVITGLQGQEHNKFYRRLDDGSTPGQGTVEVMNKETVVHGTAVSLMPDDIHSIHLESEGESKTMHLHMYGLGIDRLDKRIAFNMEEGTYKHFPANIIRK